MRVLEYRAVICSRKYRGSTSHFTTIHRKGAEQREITNLSTGEDLLTVSTRGSTVQLHDSESLRLRGWSGLGDCYLVSIAKTERWRRMRRDVPVTLLKALIFPLIVQIIATNDDRPSHLC